MKINYSEKFVKKDGVLLIPVFENETFKDFISLPELAAVKSRVSDLSASKEFEAKSGQTVFLYKLSKNLPDKIIVVGMGSKKKLSVGSAMSSIGAGVSASIKHGNKNLSFLFHESLSGFVQAVSEAIVLSSYLPGLKYKTGESLKKLQDQSLADLTVFCDFDTDQKALFEKGSIIAHGALEVRDWINSPPNYAHTDFFEARAKEIAKLPRVSLKILDKSKLEKLNMGAFLGVNRGSNVEAKMVVLEYTPKNPVSEKTVVLVGKGIIFDTGGINLKPSGHIEDMHLDKSGAATVMATIKVLAQLNYPRKVVAIAPFTDNSIGPKSLHPSEILTTYSGKTVEVLNTDAEGRLILGDAVAYGVDVYKPEMIIDLATLTGACMIALGERHAGLFANSNELMERLYNAGQSTDELLWRMPIHQDDADKMKGTFADLRNSDTGTSRLAGASKGAAYIREFVGETPWAHLDIAGPAFVSDPKKYETKGATGFGVRVLTKFFEDLVLHEG